MPSHGRFQQNFVRALTASTPLPGLFSTPQFAVYRNTWRKALVDALRDAYPVIAALIGPDAFQSLALDYIGKRAAPSPVLAGWGEGLSGFIAAHALGVEMPYFADVAALERLLTEAHLAADADPIDTSRAVDFLVASLDENVVLHPSARFAWFETPAVTIWEAHQGPGPLAAFAPDWVPERVLITRPAGRVDVTMIDVETYQLLCEIRQGAELLAAAEAIEKANPNADAAAILTHLIRVGALTDLAAKKD